MEIVLVIVAALGVACGAFFIWVTVRTFNRGFRRTGREFLRNKKSLIMVICALTLLAGAAVDTKYPIAAVAVVVVGFAVALTVARRGR